MTIVNILIQNEEEVVQVLTEDEDKKQVGYIIKKEDLSTLDKGKWTSFVNMIENKLV
jgi:hypothetical protein